VPRFKDKEGREWDVTLNVGVIGALRRDANFELGKAATAERFAETLFADPEQFVRVLWVIVEKQAEKAGVSPEEFGYSFDYETVGRATEAFMEAIIDFFHRPAAAKAIKAKLPALLKSIDKQIVTGMEATMEKAIGNQ
jgi:hypothetical protein